MERESVNQVRISNRKSLDLFTYHPQNKYEHELRKFEIFATWRDDQNLVSTEAIFETGGRADVVNHSKHIIVEVLCSEKEQDAIQKSEKYPDIYEVIYVDAQKPFNKEQIL